MEKNPSSEVIDLVDLGMDHPVYLKIGECVKVGLETAEKYGIRYFYDGGWKAEVIDQHLYTLFLLSRQ